MGVTRNLRTLGQGALASVGSVLGELPTWNHYVAEPLDRRIAGPRVRPGTWEGYPFEFDLTDYTQRAAYYGGFERSERRFIRAIARPGDVVVDVGANVGLLTLAMARAVGPGGRVIAVEPVPANARRLRENLSRGDIGRVDVVEAAIDDHDGLLHLGRSPESGDSSATSGWWSARGSASAEGERVTVPARTLEGILDELHADAGDSAVRLVKIDTEGMEASVLKSMGPWLNPSRSRALLMECVVHPEGLTAASCDTLDLTVAAGYRFGYLSATGHVRRLHEHTSDFRSSSLDWARARTVGYSVFSLVAVR